MISVIVLTKNEGKNIKDCLETLRWVDEVIVVDDNSTDETVKICKTEKAEVYVRDLAGDFASQRNFGIKQAKGEWIFFVDADERVSPQLRAEIKKAIENPAPGVKGFYFRREDLLWGRVLKHGETARVRLLRLARKGAGEWTRKVDEVWDIEGNTETLDHPLIHYPHQTLTDFLTSINQRSTLNARVFYEEGKRETLLDWFKPPAKFFQNWILRLGFLDGMPGFAVALLMCFHSFLVRAKLYLLWKQEGEWGNRK